MIFCKFRRKGFKNEQGFTLVEVMIALGILSFGVLAVASMQNSSLLGTARSSSVTTATNIAMDRMERLMALPFNTLTALSPSSGDDSDFPVASPTLPIDIEGFTWSVATGPPPVSANSRIITVRVQSKELNNPVVLTCLRITDT